MEEPIKEYYVYVYLDPRKPGNFIYEDLKFDYEPFYVGKGLHKRCYVHLKNNKRLTNTYFKNKILKILSLNLSPIIIKYIENLTEEKSYEKEGECIDKIGRITLKTGPLVNIHAGGLGKLGFSEEAKLKISQKNKMIKWTDEAKLNHSIINSGQNNPMYGKRHTIETRKKMSLKAKGKIVSEETKLILSNARKKYELTKTKCCKKIYKIVLSYKNIIYEFNKLFMCRRFLKKTYTNIFNDENSYDLILNKFEIKNELYFIEVTKLN